MSARAIKPCKLPCHIGIIDSVFDAKKCFARAKWVAVGKITKVVRKKQPRKHPPHLRMRVAFTFVIKKWEKGRHKRIRKVRFVVGFCRRAPAEKYSGLWRLYGANEPFSVRKDGQQQDPDYLHFVRVKPARRR